MCRKSTPIGSDCSDPRLSGADERDRSLRIVSAPRIQRIVGEGCGRSADFVPILEGALVADVTVVSRQEGECLSDLRHSGRPYCAHARRLVPARHLGLYPFAIADQLLTGRLPLESDRAIPVLDTIFKPTGLRLRSS